MNFNSSFVLAAAVIGLAVSGCAKKEAEPGSAAPPEPAKAVPQNVNVAKTLQVSATVEYIDVPSRIVELKTPEGRTEVVQVNPEVRNLDQVKVGDKVVVKYHQSIAAEIKPKGTSTTLNKVDESVGAARAAPGAMPGGAVSKVATTTVVVQSVDPTTNTLVFKGSDGFIRDVQVEDPQAQKFIATLKPGDEVEVTFTEALAVSVEPQT